jgi:hypothetical protein
VSFDLAVWEGPKPQTDTDALAEFERLYAEHIGSGSNEAPSPAIREFVAAITTDHPDLTDLPDDEIDEGVWSDGPLINNARGPFFYFGIVWSRAEDVAPTVARIAAKRGLVCFDPQAGTCR